MINIQQIQLGGGPRQRLAEIVVATTFMNPSNLMDYTNLKPVRQGLHVSHYYRVEWIRRSVAQQKAVDPDAPPVGPDVGVSEIKHDLVDLDVIPPPEFDEFFDENLVFELV